MNRSIDSTVKVGIFLYVFIEKVAPFGQPPKSWNFKNVISYDFNILQSKLLLLFTTTNYKRIESYVFKSFGF